MKRRILLLISVLFIYSSGNAQYRINKMKYDYHTYSYQDGDKYNPTVAGVASIIPGLGQMLSGESGRGAVFLAGFLGCNGVGAFAVSAGLKNVDNKDQTILIVADIVGLTMLLSIVAIDIYSIVDAVRVAKVNNLAWSDKNRASFNIQIQPYLNTIYYNTASISSGITLKVTF